MMDENVGPEYSQAKSTNSDMQTGSKFAKAFTEEQSGDGDIPNQTNVNRGNLQEAMQTESEGTNAACEGIEDTQHADVSEEFRAATGDNKQTLEEPSGNISDKDADILGKSEHETRTRIEYKADSKSMMSQTQSHDSVVDFEGSSSAHIHMDKFEGNLKSLACQRFGKSPIDKNEYTTQPSAQDSKGFGHTTNDGTDETGEPVNAYGDANDVVPSQVNKKDIQTASNEALETAENNEGVLSPLSENDQHDADDESLTESTNKSTSLRNMEIDKTNECESDCPPHDGSKYDEPEAQTPTEIGTNGPNETDTNELNILKVLDGDHSIMMDENDGSQYSQASSTISEWQADNKIVNAFSEEVARDGGISNEANVIIGMPPEGIHIESKRTNAECVCIENTQHAAVSEEFRDATGENKHTLEERSGNINDKDADILSCSEHETCIVFKEEINTAMSRAEAHGPVGSSLAHTNIDITADQLGSLECQSYVESGKDEANFSTNNETDGTFSPADSFYTHCNQGNEKKDIEDLSPLQVNLEDECRAIHDSSESTENKERAVSTISENEKHNTDDELPSKGTIKNTSPLDSKMDNINEYEGDWPSNDGSINDESVAQTPTEFTQSSPNQADANENVVENVFGDIRIAQQEAEVSVDEFNRNVDSLKRIDDEYSGNLKELNELRNEVPILRQKIETLDETTTKLKVKLEETTTTNAMLQNEIERLKGFEHFAKEKADAAEKLAHELESVQGQLQEQQGNLILIQSKDIELQNNQAIINTLRDEQRRIMIEYDGPEYSQAPSTISEMRTGKITANAFSEEQSGNGDISNKANVNRGKLLETMQTESEGTIATSVCIENKQQAKVSEDIRDATGEMLVETSGNMNDNDSDILSNLEHCIEIKAESINVVEYQRFGDYEASHEQLETTVNTERAMSPISAKEKHDTDNESPTESTSTSPWESELDKTNGFEDDRPSHDSSIDDHNTENESFHSTSEIGQVAKEEMQTKHTNVDETLSNSLTESSSHQNRDHVHDNAFQKGGSPTDHTVINEKSSIIVSLHNQTNGGDDDNMSACEQIILKDGTVTENENSDETKESDERSMLLTTEENPSNPHNYTASMESLIKVETARPNTEGFSQQHKKYEEETNVDNIPPTNPSLNDNNSEGTRGNPSNNTANRESHTLEETVKPSTDGNLQHQKYEVAVNFHDLSQSPQASLDDTPKANHETFERTENKVQVVSTTLENKQFDTEDDSSIECTNKDTSARRMKSVKMNEYKGDCQSRDGSTNDYYTENINVCKTNEIGAPRTLMSSDDIQKNKYDSTKEELELVQFLDSFNGKNHDNAFSKQDLPAEHGHINEKTTNVASSQHQTNVGENGSMISFGDVISKDEKVIGNEKRGNKGENSEQLLLLTTYDNCDCPPNYTGNTEPLEIEVVKSGTDRKSQHQNNENDGYSPSQIILEDEQNTSNDTFETTINRERAVSTISDTDQHDTGDESATESTIKSTSSMALMFNITNEDERNCPSSEVSIDNEPTTQTPTEYNTYSSNQMDINGQDIEKVFGDIRIAQQKAEVSVDKYNREVASLKRIVDEYSGNLKELNELRNEVPILRQKIETLDETTTKLKENLEETFATNAMLKDEVQRLEGFKHVAQEKADAAEKLAHELESVQGQFQEQQGNLWESRLLIQSRDLELQNNQAIINTLKEEVFYHISDKRETLKHILDLTKLQAGTIEGLQASVQEKNETMKQLKYSYERLQDELATARAENSGINEKYVKLQATLKDNKNEAEQLELQLGTVRAELERRASELTETQARLSYTTEQCNSQDLLIRDLRQRVLPAKDETITQLDYLHRAANEELHAIKCGVTLMETMRTLPGSSLHSALTQLKHFYDYCYRNQPEISDTMRSVLDLKVQAVVSIGEHAGIGDNISHAINAYLEVLNENATLHKEHKKQAAEIKKLKTQLWYKRSSMFN